VCLLIASALFHGASIVPLIDLVIVIDSRYVFMQFEVLLFVVGSYYYCNIVAISVPKGIL